MIWRSALRCAAVPAAYAALALVFTLPLAAEFSRAIPGDGFDGLQNYWNLWWVRRALLDLQSSPFFTRDLFYPTGTSLLFHTLNVLNGLWSLPIQLLAGPVVAYNAVVLLTFTLSGYGAYLLALDTLGRSAPRGAPRAAAFVAGFVFAFAPFRMAHLLGHMQVLSTEWLPFFALAFLRLLHRPGAAHWKGALPPAFFLLLGALCDWYYALYLLLFAAAALSWRLWRLWRARVPDRAPYAAGVLAFVATLVWFALLVSPLLVPMLAEASTAPYLRPPFDETVLLSADLLAFVTPSEFHPLWGGAARDIAGRFTSSAAERTVFAGYTVLALAALGVLRGRSRRTAFWALTGALFFVLALGPLLHVAGNIVSTVPLPYAWLYALLPLVRLTRSVSRFDVMLMLALSQLAAVGLAATPALRARRWGAVAVLLIAFEFLAVPYPLWRIEVPSFYDRIAREQGQFALLELPINWDRPDPLVYQTVHARPLLTAYTSRANPLSVVERTPVLNLLRTLEPDIIRYDTRAIGASVLADLNVRYVVNHPLTMGEGEERTVTNRVLRDLFGARAPLVNEPNLVVYRVEPPAPHRAYLALGEGWGDVQFVDGMPRREISSRAALRVVARDAQARTVRIAARAVSGSVLVEVSGSAQPLRTSLSNTLATLEATLSGPADLLIVTAAPIAVESVELVSR